MRAGDADAERRTLGALARRVGACMLSSKGACAAWYRHERTAAVRVDAG